MQPSMNENEAASGFDSLHPHYKGMGFFFVIHSTGAVKSVPQVAVDFDCSNYLCACRGPQLLCTSESALFNSEADSLRSWFKSSEDTIYEENEGLSSWETKRY